jgi:sarcosine oxidase subunit delta
MTSLVRCPHCDLRPKEEFTVRGDAAPVRPEAGADQEAWFDYVFIRKNPKGVTREYWQHVGGCRRWLVVERDVVSHAVLSVTDARAAKAGASPA